MPYSFKFLARLGIPVPVNQPIAAGDRIDEALNKLQGQINNASPGPAILVAAGTVFLVPSNKQILYSVPIEIEAGGYIESDGAIIDVN